MAEAPDMHSGITHIMGSWRTGRTPGDPLRRYLKGQRLIRRAASVASARRRSRLLGRGRRLVERGTAGLADPDIPLPPREAGPSVPRAPMSDGDLP